MATATAKKSTAKTAKAKTVKLTVHSPRLQPSEAMKKEGVVRITGRTEAKQKINFAIVDAVVVKGEEADKVGAKHKISAGQVRRIVGLARGEIDPDRVLA